MNKNHKIKVYYQGFSPIHPATVIKLTKSGYGFVRVVNGEYLVFTKKEISTKQARLATKRYLRKFETAFDFNLAP